MRDDWDQIKQAQISKSVRSKAARKDILDVHGVRYSVLNDLPGWMPSASSPVDYMHNFYLGIVKRIYYDVINHGYLLDSARTSLYKDTINSIIWPSSIGRLPKNLDSDHSLPKADQWRHLCHVLPFVLWVCWRNTRGEIISTAPPIPPNPKHHTTWRRDIRQIYRLVLYLAIAERILARHSISIADVDRGQGYIQLYCQGLQALGVSLTVNHHMAMHYSEILQRYGPVYACWLFGFERFNGLLEKVNLNGHGGGEMEYSLVRDWVEKQRLYELAVSLPEDASERERELVERIINGKGMDRGTLNNQNTEFASGGTVIPSRQTSKKHVNLRTLQHPEVYGLLISYLQSLETLGPLNIVDDMSTGCDITIVSASGSTRISPFITVNGIRIGSAYTRRTNTDEFAGIETDDSLAPCKVLYHLIVEVPHHAEPIYCSAIQRMIQGSDIPEMPWDGFATELGATVVQKGLYGPLEIVSSSQLSCPVIIIPIPHQDLGPPLPPLWVVVFCDRNGLESHDPLLD
ncbi:hypothetical protein CONPUDRAFT_160538 [Coniophora puteana RWD-64-598 SS2]|uniref:Uncharacterized protein n=1 Tax=Coniophora puteana (strain RWD-64-598) TaxID=741705 RepID=R7SDZ5_CONPW|nr:uncharacterized protein CONPUDRAFT_160538 [Coniophora puteana RWD-64-598 SS2]EIW73972.1 hypothetical protein CONPUDRAFT_160538 [Coniophora puteana RWD-64-598 SS2]